jgi:hypothetical protein
MNFLKKTNQKGFTLTEALTASALLVVAVVIFLTIQGQQVTQFSTFRNFEKMSYSANNIFEELESIKTINGNIESFNSVNLIQNSADPTISRWKLLLEQSLGVAGPNDVRSLTITQHPTDATKLRALIIIVQGDVREEFIKVIY